jgi:hypothetical protein
MRGSIAALSVVAALAFFPAVRAADEKPAAPKPDAAKPEPAKDDVVKAKGQKSRGEGKDENIKGDKSDKNDPNATIPAPAEKGGEKSRGGQCRVHFDNQTQWKIQIYVDGAYQGLLGPYADAYEWYGGTAGTLYGKADFTDGSNLTWGPQRAVCRAGAFHFQLL